MVTSDGEELWVNANQFIFVDPPSQELPPPQEPTTDTNPTAQLEAQLSLYDLLFQLAIEVIRQMDPRVAAAIDRLKASVQTAITKEVADVKNRLATGELNTTDAVAAIDELATNLTASIDKIDTDASEPAAGAPEEPTP